MKNIKINLLHLVKRRLLKLNGGELPINDVYNGVKFNSDHYLKVLEAKRNLGEAITT